MLSSKGRGGGCRRSCHVEFSRTLVIMRQASQFLSVFDFDEKLDMVTTLFAEKMDRMIAAARGVEYNEADYKAPKLDKGVRYDKAVREDGTRLKDDAASSTADTGTPAQTTTSTTTPAQTTPAQTTPAQTTTGGTSTPTTTTTN